MMKIVVAIDSLKGSLTSIQAGEAIEKGIKKVDLEAEVVIKPLADGGEGCLDAQTAMGKAPIGVAKLAKKYGKLVLGFSGAVTKGATACNEAGIDAYCKICGIIRRCYEEEKCTGEFDRYGRASVPCDKSIKIKIS